MKKFINNVEKTAKTVVQKSNDVVEITKLKMAISSAEAEAEELIADVGRLVYDAYKSGEGNPELVEEKCERLKRSRKTLRRSATCLQSSAT